MIFTKFSLVHHVYWRVNGKHFLSTHPNYLLTNASTTPAFQIAASLYEKIQAFASYLRCQSSHLEKIFCLSMSNKIFVFWISFQLISIHFVCYNFVNPYLLIFVAVKSWKFLCRGKNLREKNNIPITTYSTEKSENIIIYTYLLGEMA